MDQGHLIRPAEDADVPALTRIYGWHVLHGLGTFEEVPPDEAEMGSRLARVRSTGLWLVGEHGGAVVGYAYAAPYRDRSGYRFTFEDSVYTAPGQEGRGHGRALLSAVVAACGARGVRQIVAAIGDSGNTASIALHRGLGFAPAGVLRAVGYKHERWVDVVFMQRALTESPTPR
jgi:phosphinothricin acetyltransferase